jgi:hypothetical protein
VIRDESRANVTPGQRRLVPFISDPAWVPEPHNLDGLPTSNMAIANLVADQKIEKYEIPEVTLHHRISPHPKRWPLRRLRSSMIGSGCCRDGSTYNNIHQNTPSWRARRDQTHPVWVCLVIITITTRQSWLAPNNGRPIR